MTRPLDGILVVALEQVIAAPFCSRQLADLGARVIKIERPDGGDFARGYDRRARGLSSHFVWCNRSKESVALDLKTPAARDALARLIARADVFLQNLAPGAVERLGFGADPLRAKHPRLITCSISGYGAGGPWSERKAYDLLVQAEAGFLSVTGTKEAPAKAGASIVDIAAGTSAFSGILAAILQRQRTNEGSHVEVSMLEAMTEWMSFPLYYAMDGAEPPARSGAGHATIFPYGPFATKDGTVLFGLQNDREWAAFAEIVLERRDLAADPRFRGTDGRAQHRATLEPVVTSIVRSLTTHEATRRLEKAGIGMARVNDMRAVWAHPQLAARQRWAEVATPAGPIPALVPGSNTGWTPRMDPIPALGEHTSSVLAEIGLSDAEIKALQAV